MTFIRTVEGLAAELSHEDDGCDEESDDDPAEGEEHVRVAQRDRLVYATLVLGLVLGNGRGGRVQC